MSTRNLYAILGHWCRTCSTGLLQLQHHDSTKAIPYRSMEFMYLPRRVGLACEGDSSIAPTADYYACTSQPYRNPSLSAFLLEEKAPNSSDAGKNISVDDGLATLWSFRLYSSILNPILPLHCSPDLFAGWKDSICHQSADFLSIPAIHTVQIVLSLQTWAPQHHQTPKTL